MLSLIIYMTVSGGIGYYFGKRSKQSQLTG